jgi:hypothetical protein
MAEWTHDRCGQKRESSEDVATVEHPMTTRSVSLMEDGSVEVEPVMRLGIATVAMVCR